MLEKKSNNKITNKVSKKKGKNNNEKNMNDQKNKKTTKKVMNNNKEKISSYYILPDNSNLEIIEKKYCSCLMKVRSKKNPIPYGICTDAVYKSRGLIRDKVVECTEYYDFNKYNLKMLKMFAKEKKIKGYSKLNKRELLIELKKYQEMKRMKLLNKNNKK